MPVARTLLNSTVALSDPSTFEPTSIAAVEPRAGPAQHASLDGGPGADSGAGRDGDPRAGGEQWVELRAHGAGVVRVAEDAFVADREAERAAAMVEEAHAIDHRVTGAAE